MNKTEILERINRVANERDAEKTRKNEEEFRRRLAIVNAVKELAPRISDMLDIAQHLYKNGISIGPKRSLHGCPHSDEFVSSWWWHNLGFCYDSSMRPREEYPLWIGFINGGACGEDMCVDRHGSVVKGRQKYMDMQYMLKHFDAFEQKFYEYVESL